MVRNIGHIATRFLAALVMLMSTQMPANAETTETDRAALNEIIRDYILANPEVVREALIELNQREERQRVEMALSILREDAGDPILGNPDGNFVIYEFTDYNCGYCKQVFKQLQELLATDSEIKLVIKEFPILSQTSVLAAQAGIAAQAQDVFPAFHVAMMTARGTISMESILDAAEKAGADTAKLQADMNSPGVATILDRTRTAAQALEISGTPGLVIGSQVIPGAISIEQLREIVAAERAANS
tara:strand:+ start:355 stop:1089 length:735 start_codon:yes stop_codon:yes gene_type:complete